MLHLCSYQLSPFFVFYYLVSMLVPIRDPFLCRFGLLIDILFFVFTLFFLFFLFYSLSSIFPFHFHFLFLPKDVYSFHACFHRLWHNYDSRRNSSVG